MLRTQAEVKWLKHSRKFGEHKFTASSAENKPAHNVNPVVVQVTKEKGIDISQNKPKLLTFQMVDSSDLIVTMGCKASVLGHSSNQQSNGNLKTPKTSLLKRLGKFEIKSNAKSNR